MKSFLWTMLLNSVLLQCTTNADCITRVNEITCMEEKECEGYVKIEEFYSPATILRQCQDFAVFLPMINVYCLPVNLTYKEHNLQNNIPMFHNVIEETYMNCVKLLDISNNNYLEMPSLEAMKYLSFVNISSNLISIAKLSSEYDFPVLNEMDISNNLINSIEVDSDEFAFSNLTKLNLSNNRLSNIIDANFKAFPELQYIDLSYNEISEINSFSFEGMIDLLYLNLAHNKLKEINKALLRFTKLQYLYLNNNKLTSVLLADLENLNKVIEIDLSHNIITFIEKNVFDNMPFLNRLNLKKNLLSYMEPRMFFNSSALKSIDLSQNEIRKIPKYIFKGRKMHFFDIRQNILEGELAKGTFEGLLYVVELDISHQRLTSIEDFAFVGLETLQILMLNNNKIRNISEKSFDSLRNLKRLDLSDNQIHELNFEVMYLLRLEYLSLKSNLISVIAKGHFDNLNVMEMLDVSYNNISKVDAFSFKDLSQLINFDISKNPLSETLENNTFSGLIALPVLDISGTSIKIIKNNSFNEMTSLHTLNISHSTLNEVSFNSFINTSNLNVLDLSHNFLKVFNINTKTLIKLRVLYLDHNLIEFVSPDFVASLSTLNEISLSHNKIVFLYDEIFRDLKSLASFDISYNPNLVFNSTFINMVPTVQKLNIAGIKNSLTFNDNKQLAISVLVLSKCGISNVTTLRLSNLEYLNSLSLNNNNIQKLEVGALNNLTNLRFLDLSENNLLFIQPGVFKDNYNLNVLNISHNNLSTFNYGICHGLSNLSELDLSYNQLVELKSERFYGIKTLKTLIVDFNMITSISVDEFSDYFSVLSIGHNPIKCDSLMELKNKLIITAINLDVTHYNNIDGISCLGHVENRRNFKEMNGTENILIDIRDILLNLSSENNLLKRKKYDENLPIKLDTVVTSSNQKDNKNNNTSELIRIFNQSLINVIHDVALEQSISNTLLERILKMIVTLNTQTTPLPVAKYNISNENIGNVIAKLKQDFDNALTIEKEKVLADVSDKILIINKKIDNIATIKPSSEFKATNSDSLFTEICVALILIILLCFTVFIIYKYVILSSRQRSYSTQHITEFANSNL